MKLKKNNTFKFLIESFLGINDLPWKLISILYGYPDLTEEEYNCFSRMEILGDAILRKEILLKLMKIYPTANAGYLTKRLVYLVSGNILSSIVEKQKFCKLLSSNRSFFSKNKNKIYSDILEVLIYIKYTRDTENKLKSFIDILYSNYIYSSQIDHKSFINNHLISSGIDFEYKVVSKYFEIHQASYLVVLNIYAYGILSYYGVGQSIKSAEKEAAKKAIDNLFYSNTLLE